MNLLLVVLLIIILLIVAVTVGVTLFTFYHPVKNRVVPKVISDYDRDYYGANTNELIRAMDEMDATESEKVLIKSMDGLDLVGHLFIRDENKPFMIFAHGYHGTYMRDGYGSYRVTKDIGINILMIEQRSHGNSGGNFTTFGVKERHDVFKWIEYINERYNYPDIILSGVSMGSATVMMTTGLELTKNVKGVIEDCGYTSPKEIIINTARGMKLPGAQLYPLARIGAILAARADMNSCRAIDCIKKTKLPVLFIHSRDDGFVPFSMSDSLFTACQSNKSRLIIEGAPHAVNALYFYDVYKSSVLEFLEKNNII